MTACIFCRIVRGDLPSYVVAESDRAIAFLDIQPAELGHTLVVPRAHAANLDEISLDDLQACAELAKRIAASVRSALKTDGVSIVQSNGVAAGQTVFHYHVHIIPRYDGDALRSMWTPGEASAEELARVADQLQA